MSERIKQKLGFVVAAAMVLAGLAVLNVGSLATGATKCEPAGGGNETESPSPSPSESDEPFPPSLPPILPSESESASPSPSESDEGGARECGSEITIKYRGPDRRHPGRSEFTGKVRSDEEACEAGRKVTVKKDRKGRRDPVVDQTVTNDRGTWRAPVRNANGRYYARTPKERVASDEGRVTCLGDKSKTIRV